MLKQRPFLVEILTAIGLIATLVFSLIWHLYNHRSSAAASCREQQSPNSSQFLRLNHLHLLPACHGVHEVRSLRTRRAGRRSLLRRKRAKASRQPLASVEVEHDQAGGGIQRGGRNANTRIRV